MHKKMTILKKLSEYDKLDSTDKHILKNTKYVISPDAIFTFCFFTTYMQQSLMKSLWLFYVSTSFLILGAVQARKHWRSLPIMLLLLYSVLIWSKPQRVNSFSYFIRKDWKFFKIMCWIIHWPTNPFGGGVKFHANAALFIIRQTAHEIYHINLKYRGQSDKATVYVTYPVTLR